MIKKIGAFFLIGLGLTLILIGVFPIFKMNQQMGAAQKEWEEIVQQSNEVPVVKPEIDEEETPSSEFEDAQLVGMMTFESNKQQLPIRMGITNAILDQGVGLDTDTEMLGTTGNTVLYGHREQVFWNLKDIKLGDSITIQLRDQTLTYEVFEATVVSPDDELIYQHDEGVITLVTCYPFIYMGPITDRYMVKARLN